MYLLPSTHKHTHTQPETNTYIDKYSDSAYIAAVADIFHK